MNTLQYTNPSSNTALLAYMLRYLFFLISRQILQQLNILFGVQYDPPLSRFTPILMQFPFSFPYLFLTP